MTRSRPVAPAGRYLQPRPLLEVSLRVREGVQGKAGRERDRGTRVLIAGTLGAAIGLAGAAASLGPVTAQFRPSGERLESS